MVLSLILMIRDTNCELYIFLVYICYFLVEISILLPVFCFEIQLCFFSLVSLSRDLFACNSMCLILQLFHTHKLYSNWIYIYAHLTRISSPYIWFIRNASPVPKCTVHTSAISVGKQTKPIYLFSYIHRVYFKVNNKKEKLKKKSKLVNKCEQRAHRCVRSHIMCVYRNLWAWV